MQLNDPLSHDSLSTVFVVELTAMKFLLLLLPALALHAQDVAANLGVEKITAPPAIVLSVDGEKVSATLLATADVPAGTYAVPVVVTPDRRMVFPGFQITGQSPYPLVTAPAGAEIGVFLTTPNGHPFMIRSHPILRGYEYDAGILTVYGNFIAASTFVYVANSLIPIRPTLNHNRIEFPLKATGAVVTVTVYQVNGFCDTIAVRLQQSADFK